MKRPADLEKLADEAADMAARTSDLRLRRIFWDIARQWRGLAAQAEAREREMEALMGNRDRPH
jgi:hypothetical protein